MEYQQENSEIKLISDYYELLRELDSLELLRPVFSPAGKFEQLGFILDTLNNSFDIRGEATVTSEVGIEIVRLPDQFQPENPLERIDSMKVYKIPDFSHQGYCLGFKYSQMHEQFVISFTDDVNPWEINASKVQPTLQRTFHVPISEPHTVSVVDGLTISRAA